MTIWRFTCHFLEETNVMRRLRMHKSRRAVKFPRRTSTLENQAPTLIIVKDFKSDCFTDRAEQVDKTNFLGRLLFCSQRQNIFHFRQDHHSSWYGPGYTHADREPTGMCDVTSGSEQMIALVPSLLHLLIMGPGKNNFPSPGHCIFINITWWSQWRWRLSHRATVKHKF